MGNCQHHFSIISLLVAGAKQVHADARMRGEWRANLRVIRLGVAADSSRYNSTIGSFKRTAFALVTVRPLLLVRFPSGGISACRPSAFGAALLFSI